MKVVVLTAKFGMGHLSASKAVKEEIEKANKNVEVKIIDFYEYSIPALADCIYKGFSLVLKFGKKAYSEAYMANDKDNEKEDLLLKRFVYSTNKLIEEEEPDIIVSTFPLISRGVSFYKEEYNSDIPLITCITDISSHYEWISKNIDKYMAPCDEVKEALMHKGVDEEKIVVYGIPVAMRFKEMFLEKEYTPKKIVYLNNYTRKKELLIMGGGLGLLPEDEEFYKDLNSRENIHTTIVAGNNKKIFEMLNGRYENITVTGYTDEVDKLMNKADLILTKPGGITVFESIYSLTPIVSFKTDLPNELENIEFIEDNNFGIGLHTEPDKSLNRIIKLLNNDKKLKSMKRSMKEFVESLDNDYFARTIGKERTNKII